MGYDEGDVENFQTAVLAEFNKTVGGNITKVCTCNQKEITFVEKMIACLLAENGVGEYAQPEASAVAAAVCDLNGLPAGAERDKMMASMIEQIQADRKLLMEELKT